MIPTPKVEELERLRVNHARLHEKAFAPGAPSADTMEGMIAILEAKGALRDYDEYLKAISKPEFVEALVAERTSLLETLKRRERALQQAQNVVDLLTDQAGAVRLIPFDGDNMTEEEWREEILGEFDTLAIPRIKDEPDLAAFVFLDASGHGEGHLLLAPEYPAFLKESRAAPQSEGGETV